MSERPTISVYVNDRIADYGYYHNYNGLELLGVAIHTARLLDGCAAVEDVQRRLEIKAFMENAPSAPEIPAHFNPPEHDKQLMASAAPLSRSGGHHPDEELLLEMEGCSEFPIVIDLTRRVIYASTWRHEPSANFGDDIEVIPWQRWVDETDDDGADGWYRYWPKTAAAVSFDELDDLMEWLVEDVANCKAASRKRVTATELAALAETDDGYVRAKVALNPNTSVETLRELAQDRRWWVRRATIKNDNAPSDIFISLAKDGHPNVRETIALNLKAPKEALRLLAHDPDPKVRYFLSANYKAPADARRTLAQDEDSFVRKSIAENVTGEDDPELLVLLAHDPDPRVREQVVHNFYVSTEILQLLADDEDEDVRKWARRDLERRAERHT